MFKCFNNCYDFRLRRAKYEAKKLKKLFPALKKVKEENDGKSKIWLNIYYIDTINYDIQRSVKTPCQFIRVVRVFDKALSPYFPSCVEKISKEGLEELEDFVLIN